MIRCKCRSLPAVTRKFMHCCLPQARPGSSCWRIVYCRCLAWMTDQTAHYPQERGNLTAAARYVRPFVLLACPVQLFSWGALFLVPPREKRPRCDETSRLPFVLSHRHGLLGGAALGSGPTDSPARIDRISVLTSYRAGSAESSCSPASRRVGSVRPPIAIPLPEYRPSESPGLRWAVLRCR